jgi:hypothetical protein
MTSAELRAEIKQVFPALRHMWLLDPEYQVPALADLTTRAALCWPADEYRAQVFECEEFSMAFIVAMRRKEVEAGQGANWPLFLALADKLNGSEYNHVVTVALCEEGVFIIDAQAKEIRPSHNDNIYFLVG